MPIITPGHTPGFRGRKLPATWVRRTEYLRAEHGRDGVALQGPHGRDLTAAQSVALLGGPEAEYHEVIVAPSQAECDTIRGRNPAAPRDEALMAGHRVAQAYTKGGPYVLAMHEQDGRFHFHIAAPGPRPNVALGRQGTMQKAWDREFLGDEPRIQNWEAHRRFKALKVQLEGVIREQRELVRQRREAVREAPPGHKLDASRPFDERARDLVGRRYELEVSALLARYEARGAVGSPRHQSELEQTHHRRTGALHRLERRGTIPCNGLDQTQDLGRAGLEGAKSAGLKAVSLAEWMLPRELQPAARIATTIAQTAVDLTKDAVNLSPVSMATTLVKGAARGVKEVARAAGSSGSALPDPVQRALQVASWVPVAGQVAQVVQGVAEVANVVLQPLKPLPPGVER